jgi:putative ABC transport system permease protein
MRPSVSLLLARRALRRRPLRAVLTAAGIVLGVGMIVAVLSLSATLLNGFRGLYDTVYGKTDLIVQRDTGTGGQAPFSQSLLRRVLAVPGVDARRTTGEVDGVSQLVNGAGRSGSSARDIVYVGGFRRGSVDAVSNFDRVAGRDPAADDQISIQDKLADQRGLHVGSTLRLAVPAGIRTFRVSGIFRFTRPVDYGGSSFALLTLPAAQAAFDLEGRLTQIDVNLRDRGQLAQVQRQLKHVLGGQLSVRTRAQSVDELSKQLGALETFLLFFAGVALFVGAFLIYNAFNVTVLQRTREIGMLRTLGLTRAGVMRQVMAEAVGIGIAGSLLGLAAGVGLAWGLVKLMTLLFSSLPIGTLTIPTSAYVEGVVAGILVTAFGALWPAVKASRTSPLQAMRLRAERIGRIPWRTALAGVVLLALSAPGVYVLTQSNLSTLASVYGLFGVFGVFLGVTLAAPLIVHPLVELLGWPMRMTGRAQGRLASDNAARAPSRTGLTASSVMVGLALVIVFGAFSSSMVSAVRSAVDRQFRSDYVVGPKNLMTMQGFSPTLERRIAALPAARVTTSVTDGFTKVNGVPTVVLGYDPRTIGALTGVTLVGGGQPDWLALEGNSAFVYQGWAAPNHVSAGDILRIAMPGGGADRIRVAGILESPDQHVVLSQQRTARDTGSTNVFYVWTKAADTTAARAALGRQLRSVVADYPNASVLSNSQLKNQITSQFNQIFTLIYALLAVAVIASALGIANTMAMSVLERTREIGLVRALGGTRRQVRGMVRRESLLVTAVGVILGFAVGIVMGYVFVRAMASSFPGLVYVAPWSLIAAVMAGALVVALLAAIMPARRAARLNVIEAVGYE